MDTGSNGSVEVGGADDASEMGAGAGVTICITVMGDKITMEQYAAGGTPTGNGQEVDIGEAMKAVIEAYEGQESPEGDEANFQAGLAGKGGPATIPGEMMG